MRKSLGDKRKEIGEEQIKHITELYVDALAVAADPEHPEHAKVKVFGTTGLRLPPDHRRAAAQAALRDHRGHARGPGGSRSRWPSGTGGTCSSPRCAGSARHGVVDEAGGEAGLLKAARSGGSLWPSSAPFAEGDLGGGLGLRPRRRGPEGQGRLPSRTRTCATTRTCRWTRTSRPTSPARSSRTSPTPGSTTTKTKIGYEIPFTRHFYVYTPPRPLAEIDAELRDLESQIQKLLGEVTG